MTPPFYILEDGLTDGDIVSRQKVDCRRRGACLSVAIERKQSVFVCVDPNGTPCPSYSAMTQRELHDDVEPLLRLVGNVLRPGRHIH